MKSKDIGFGKIGCITPEEKEFVREKLDTYADVRIRIITILGFMGKHMKARFDKELERTGLTVTQIQTLFYILQEQHKREREITAKELEQRFRVSNPTMSGILRRLENKGLIERTPGSLDKRNKQIRVREDMSLLYERVEERVAREEERLFRNFTEEELDGLSKSLRKLLRNIEDGEE